LKKKYLLLISVFVCVSWLPAIGYGAEASGEWVAKIMGAKIRAFVEQHGTELSGFAKIKAPNGKNSTYHFAGSIDGNRVHMAHHHGHSFSGQLTSSRTMEGVLRTKGGQSVPVTATRK
jgi:hypothetical protein